MVGVKVGVGDGVTVGVRVAVDVGVDVGGKRAEAAMQSNDVNKMVINAGTIRIVCLFIVTSFDTTCSCVCSTNLPQENT